MQEGMWYSVILVEAWKSTLEIVVILKRPLSLRCILEEGDDPTCENLKNLSHASKYNVHINHLC